MVNLMVPVGVAWTTRRSGIGQRRFGEALEEAPIAERNAFINTFVKQNQVTGGDAVMK